MPTYQTTPYISWTFPDQAIAMNRKGVQPLKVTDLPRQDMVVGDAKYGWAEDARKMALAALETNRIKDEGMRGLLNTTDRSQAHDRPAHLSQTRINGKFLDPSYQYTQTPSGLRGGTGLLTKEGRAWAKRKLQQRVQELNAIDSQNYTAGPPGKVTILPELYKVESTLAKLLNYVYSGAISTDILDALQDFVMNVLTAAPSMTAADVSRYINALNPLEVSITRTITEGQNVTDTEKRILNIAGGRIRAIYKLLVEIADVSQLPEVAKTKSLRIIADRWYRRHGTSTGAPTFVMGRRTIRVPRERLMEENPIPVDVLYNFRNMTPEREAVLPAAVRRQYEEWAAQQQEQYINIPQTNVGQTTGTNTRRRPNTNVTDVDALD